MRRRLALLLGAGGLGLLVLSATPIPAQADAPIRVGWWNAASANGTAAPSPTTPSGGLRVAAGPGGTTPVPGVAAAQLQVLAYGALLYQADEGSTGTLTLKIAGSAQGTPQLVACPTDSDVWTTGDDQATPGPSYNCNSGSFPGTVSADGTSVSFHISAESESTPGQLCLAIVPDLSSTTLPTGPSPFAVDFRAPDEGSFLTEGGGAASSAGPAFNPTYVAPPESTGGPLGLPAFNAPAIAPARSQPSGGAPSAARAGAAPAARPVTVPASVLLRSHVATALGVLVLLLAVLLWSAGFGLLGGRVRPLSLPLRRV